MKEQERTESRAAVVYQIAAGPRSGWWRVRVEKRPEVSGWVGGRVLWHCDSPDREPVDSVAEAWTERGELPAEPLAPPPPPRVWSLPAEPGPEVTRLRDREGELWHCARHGGWAPVDQKWSQLGLRWANLLLLAGPLTDATPTEESKPTREQGD